MPVYALSGNGKKIVENIQDPRKNPDCPLKVIIVLVG